MGRPLLALVGPTASGKSAAASHLALAFGGEIINADPQQFYRGMDVGTAKPSAEEQGLVPHHLLDVISPEENVGLAVFQRFAVERLAEIWGRGRLPIVVGGSGQYIWGLIEGWTVPEVPPDVEYRERLMARAQVEGNQTLYDELLGVDPEAAAKIHVNNVRRVVRALEVYERTGRPISSCQARQPIDAETCVLGMEVEREELDRRIEKRTAHMFEAGLVEEVRGLLDAGYDTELPALRSIGYREVVAHLQGESTLDEARELICRGTRRLARRQMAWFRREDPRITWVPAGDLAAIEAVVAQRLSLRHA
ncbi:MAG: tRNA (adenosine(37)-N6)-dimethylallyltransferase MiaA [Dehalococcoidia bacterium]